MGFYPHFRTGQAVRRRIRFLSFFLSGLTAVLRLTGVFAVAIGALTLRGTGVLSALAGFLARVGGRAGASWAGTGGAAGAAALAARAGLGSNSNPVVPSGWRSRPGAHVRPVRLAPKV